jgi:hypothetical protein
MYTRTGVPPHWGKPDRRYALSKKSFLLVGSASIDTVTVSAAVIFFAQQKRDLFPIWLPLANPKREKACPQY